MTRSDAARNRAAVLAAARALFVAHGPDVQMADIAKAAGVGVGTIYRQFRSRDALIDAVGDARFADIERYARDHCLGAEAGLAKYLRFVGDVLSSERGLSRVIEARSGTTEPRGPAREALEEVIGLLVDDARASGEVAADTTLADVDLVLAGLSAVIRWEGDWRRYLEITTRGLFF